MFFLFFLPLSCCTEVMNNGRLEQSKSIIHHPDGNVSLSDVHLIERYTIYFCLGWIQQQSGPVIIVNNRRQIVQDCGQ